VGHRLVALLAAVALLPACTHETTRKPPPNGNEALDAARARLSVLARATANAVYDATYVVTYRVPQATQDSKGSIRIVQKPPRYRIDIIGRDVASYYVGATGIVSCSIKGPKRTKRCFLVAHNGEPVPALFDPGVQRLFRDVVEDLAAHPTDYNVVAVPRPTPSGKQVGSSECFTVVRNASPSATRTGFEDGTYCLAERGYATYIDVESGTLLLSRFGPPPPESAFKPFAKVEQLPDLTPSPTPKK
jgi:hypothetical protein